MKAVSQSTYLFKYIDDYESVDGEVQALDATCAAIAILQDCGTEPGRPRWKRYGVSEKALNRIPGNAELVEISRLNEFLLDIRVKGSRKRKPMRIMA